MGQLFDQDTFFAGTGVAFGIGLIPKLSAQVLSMTGVASQSWYSGEAKFAVDVLTPAAVGSLGLMAASSVRMGGALGSFLRGFGKGFAIAGIGLAVGRIVDRFISPSLPEQIRPAPTPGQGDYLQAGDEAGIRDYLQEGDALSSAGVSGYGDSMEYGVESEVTARLREERTF